MSARPPQITLRGDVVDAARFVTFAKRQIAGIRRAAGPRAFLKKVMGPDHGVTLTITVTPVGDSAEIHSDDTLIVSPRVLTTSDTRIQRQRVFNLVEGSRAWVAARKGNRYEFQADQRFKEDVAYRRTLLKVAERRVRRLKSASGARALFDIAMELYGVTGRRWVGGDGIEINATAVEDGTIGFNGFGVHAGKLCAYFVDDTDNGAFSWDGNSSPSWEIQVPPKVHVIALDDIARAGEDVIALKTFQTNQPCRRLYSGVTYSSSNDSSTEFDVYGSVGIFEHADLLIDTATQRKTQYTMFAARVVEDQEHPWPDAVLDVGLSAAGLSIVYGRGDLTPYIGEFSPLYGERSEVWANVELSPGDNVPEVFPQPIDALVVDSPCGVRASIQGDVTVQYTDERGDTVLASVGSIGEVSWGLNRLCTYEVDFLSDGLNDYEKYTILSEIPLDPYTVDGGLGINWYPRPNTIRANVVCAPGVIRDGKVARAVVVTDASGNVTYSHNTLLVDEQVVSTLQPTTLI